MKQVTMRLMASGVWLLAAAGCSFLAPQPDPSQYFVLAPITDAEVPPTDASMADVSVGVGPLRFPDYLLRYQIATRVAPNRLVFADSERWAEPIETTFARVLSQNLTRLLRTERVMALPMYVATALTYEVPMEVVQFEREADGRVTLWARWAVQDATTHRLLYTAQSQLSAVADGPTMEASVAAQSRVLADLSREVAAALRAAHARPAAERPAP